MQSKKFVFGERADCRLHGSGVAIFEMQWHLTLLLFGFLGLVEVNATRSDQQLIQQHFDYFLVCMW